MGLKVGFNLFVRSDIAFDFESVQFRSLQLDVKTTGIPPEIISDKEGVLNKHGLQSVSETMQQAVFSLSDIALEMGKDPIVLVNMIYQRLREFMADPEGLTQPIANVFKVGNRFAPIYTLIQFQMRETFPLTFEINAEYEETEDPGNAKLLKCDVRLYCPYIPEPVFLIEEGWTKQALIFMSELLVRGWAYHIQSGEDWSPEDHYNEIMKKFNEAVMATELKMRSN